MGCDLEYFLDTDLHGLNGKEFIKKFEERAGEKLCLTNYQIFYPTEEEKLSLHPEEDRWKRINSIRPSRGWELIYGGAVESYLENSDLIEINYLAGNDDDNFEIAYYGGQAIALYQDMNDRFGLFYPRRYRSFCHWYLKEKDAEVIQKAKEGLENIKKKIAPIFGSTKMIVYGDQIDEHEIFSNCLFEGDSIDEALKKSKDDLKNSPLLTKSGMLSYVPNEEYTPMFLFDLTK